MTLRRAGRRRPDFERWYGDLARTQITRLVVQDVLRDGIDAAAEAAVARLLEPGRIADAGIAIYDPERRYAGPPVEMLGAAFSRLA